MMKRGFKTKNRINISDKTLSDSCLIEYPLIRNFESTLSGKQMERKVFRVVLTFIE